MKGTQRNISAIVWRFAGLLGCILAGAILGEGLRLFGLIGRILFWLLISFHILLALFLLTMIFSVWKDDKLASYKGGGLNEYLWLSLLFDSGLIPGLWFKTLTLSENIQVIVFAGLALGVGIFVFIIS